MSNDFGPDHPRYTIVDGPSTMADLEPAIIAAANTIGRLFEMRALAAREEARRAIVELETKASIECFEQEMEKLERRFAADEQGALERQKGYFAVANRLLDDGKHEAALAVLKIISNEGRRSFVKDLIEYHERVSLGSVKMGDKE